MADDHSHEITSPLLIQGGPIVIKGAPAGGFVGHATIRDDNFRERGRKNVLHPRAYKGHVLVDDIEEGLGILTPGGGLFRPILTQTIRNEPEMRGLIAVERRVFHAGGVKADSVEDLLRKFVDRDEG